MLFYAVADAQSHKILYISWTNDRMIDDVQMNMQHFSRQICKFKITGTDVVFWSQDKQVQWEMYPINLFAEGSMIKREICVAFDLDNHTTRYATKEHYQKLEKILNLKLRQTLIFNEWNLS